jgi:hypothetical protein
MPIKKPLGGTPGTYRTLHVVMMLPALHQHAYVAITSVGSETALHTGSISTHA